MKTLTLRTERFAVESWVRHPECPGKAQGRFCPDVLTVRPWCYKVHLASLHRLYGVFLGHGELSPEAGSFGVRIAVIARIECSCWRSKIVAQPSNRILQDPPRGSVNCNDPHTGIDQLESVDKSGNPFLFPPSSA